MCRGIRITVNNAGVMTMVPHELLLSSWLRAARLRQDDITQNSSSKTNATTETTIPIHKMMKQLAKSCRPNRLVFGSATFRVMHLSTFL